MERYFANNYSTCITMLHNRSNALHATATNQTIPPRIICKVRA